MKKYDIIIIGGGLTGVVATIALSQAGLSVALVDQKSRGLVYDNRAFAIAKNSKDILSKFKIWTLIEKNAEPILNILIMEGHSPLSVRYDCKAISDEPMGYIIDGSELHTAINKTLDGLNNVVVYAPNSYKNVCTEYGFVKVMLNCGTELNSQLLICSEGRRSKLRSLLGVPAINHDYAQSSISCNILHTKNHSGNAIERFFPRGPFAILPMLGGHKSSIVWTDKYQIVDMLMNISEEEFLVELKKKVGFHLGEISIDNKRVAYPLFFLFTYSLCSRRSIILGEAAHTIHPVAGQGFNLSLMDIKSMWNILLKSKEFGIDIGSDYTLKKFSQDRYFDNFAMATITHGLNTIFSNRLMGSKFFRNLGLGFLEHSEKIKQNFIRYAMGMRYGTFGTTVVNGTK